MRKLVQITLKSRKFWKRILVYLVLLPLLLFTLLIGILIWKQDEVVQHLLQKVNKDFKGLVEIKDSHISVFQNFPYISIDVENMVLYENKEKNTEPITEIKDVYLGFDLWTIVSGDMVIKKIKLSEGKLNLVQHTDGTINLLKAIETEKKAETTEEEYSIDLKEIELVNIDLIKLNETSNVTIETYINYADSRFKTSKHLVYASLESKFMTNVISGKDTTFIKHKHFDVKTEIEFLKKKQKMTIKPSTVKLEGAEFNMKGEIDFLNDMFVDFTFDGNKPNFDLFIAMAPEEIIPALKLYKNQGKIYFSARVIGKTAGGKNPFIKAQFGCKDAYFNNFKVKRKLNDLTFRGYFTNGSKMDKSTMELSIQNLKAKPEAGIFIVNLSVKNFESPEINLKLDSDFELDFLAKFLNLNELQNLKGRVNLVMNFKDIIDLQHPEKSLSKLNESYFTELKITNLSFNSKSLPAPIKDIDLYAYVKGHETKIDYADIHMGKSDIHFSGTISDLPAILHHTSTLVTTDLHIKSKHLNLNELTGKDSSSIDEEIKNLSLDLMFKSSAKAITESPHLPVGEFFIQNLYADLKHYPHTLHDFHADMFIDNKDFRLVNFKGMIDKSDFLFSGKLANYDLWFKEKSVGDTKIEFDLLSDVLKLKDIFSYKGANYVPENYRHEEFTKLNLHGYCDLHFKEKLYSVDMNLNKFSGKMKLHKFRFENFKGRVHYENDHLVVENFSGKLGQSDFKTKLHYYLGQDETVKKRDNHFELTSSHLNFDELFDYNPQPSTATTEVNHDAGFNIYKLPFTQMTFDINIAHLNYHRYLIQNFKTKFTTTKNHNIHFDYLKMNTAGGTFDITGNINGSNPEKIFFTPKIHIRNVELDKLLFKFDNFGQDHLVSENLHGKFNGEITGNIHLHNDLVPKVDDSDIRINMQVLNGRLENFAMLIYMSDYFQDKNLKKVYFDTLTNNLQFSGGVLTIPNMQINSSLGFIEFEGKQDMKLNMDYSIKVPWKLITQAASSKLFGKKAEEVDPDQIDAIQYADKDKKNRYLHVHLLGNPENYTMTLGKKKDKKKTK